MVISFLLFLIAVIMCFTLPGAYLLGKSKIDFNTFERAILGTTVGFVLFTLLTYILLVINHSYLIVPIVILVNIFALKNNLSAKLNIKLPNKKQLIILLIIFLLGMIGQLAIIASSGSIVNGDIIFYSSNGHDGPWHLALMEEIKKGYPLQNPTFAGERLVNYHFFSDLAPAQFSQYLNLSSLDLYFKFFPFLFSILLGSSAFLLGKRIGGSFAAGAWSAFFVYFAGSFGYFITWFRTQNIGGESIFWATQIQSSIGNPPQIISNILVLTFLYFLSTLLSKKNAILFGICVVLLASLIGFKVYASIVLLISLALIGIIELIKHKRIYLLTMCAFATLISVVIYLPNTTKASSFLIWEPWWFIRSMIVAENRLDWLDLEHKRQTYIVEGNLKRVIQIELTGFLIFFFGNLGTRFLGLIFFAKFFKKILTNPFYQILLFTCLTSLTIPLLFLQKGVAPNTIQFLQYFLLIMGLLAAIIIAHYQICVKAKIIKVLFFVSIITYSIPTQVGLIYEFYRRPPLAKISQAELQALTFLKQNTDKNSIILTPYYTLDIDFKKNIRPIWAWSDTAYISAFSSRRTYLSDNEQVDIMGYDYKQRLPIQKFIFGSSKKEIIIEEIKKNKINYIYFPKQLRPYISPSIYATNVFKNEEIEIWQVN